MLQALIWDIDGTVAETERDGHRVAFNGAFESMGVPWRWDVETYGRLLAVTGGLERLLHDMASRREAPHRPLEREALARELHRRKNARYAEIVATGALPARPGVLRLMAECRHSGVALGIATTTSRANVEALFDSLLGTDWQSGFGAVVCADDAPVKKPDPLAYRMALERLQVAPAGAFAIEDSPQGLQAALAAGVACGVTRSRYFAQAAFDGAAWVRDDLETPAPMTLAELVPAARVSMIVP